MLNRIIHWLAGLFCGYLCWINLGAAILLAILFNYFQVINQYAHSDKKDFQKDVWDFMFAAFIGVAIGFIFLSDV